MAYEPRTSAGTKLKMEISTVYTLIPGINDISFSGGEKTTMDATPLDVTSGAVGVAGLPTPEECTVTGFYDPANSEQQALRTAAATAGQVDKFQVHYVSASGKMESFNAEVASFVTTPQRGNVLQFTSKLILKTARTLGAAV